MDSFSIHYKTIILLQGKVFFKADRKFQNIATKGITSPSFPRNLKIILTYQVPVIPNTAHFLFFFPLIYPEIRSENLKVIFQKLVLKSLQGMRKDGVS